MFHKIEHSSCVLRSGGVFRQTECYAYAGFIHAKFSGGYVRLYKADPCGIKGTSKPGMSWDSIELPFPPKYNSVGALILPT